MAKVLFLNLFQVIICSFVFIGCNTKKTGQQKTIPEPVKKEQVQVPKTISKDSLSGIWVSSRRNSFRIVEIPNRDTAFVTRFEKWQNNGSEKIVYEKFKGAVEVTYGSNISIQTERFRFIYFHVKDTLFEMAEPGRVDTLLRVENGKIVEKITTASKK